MKRWLVVGACLSLFALYVAMQFALKQAANPQSPNVFGSFWESGRAAWAGGNPYAAGAFTIEWQAGPFTFLERNLNPPSTLPLFQVLALTDAYTAARAWLLLSAFLFLLPALRISRTARLYQIPWLFLLSIDTISIGQVYAPLFTLSALAWVALQRNRHVLAGIAIGFVVAAKPNFAVWPTLLLLAGHWRSATSAGLTATLLAAIPVFLYGGDVYSHWLAAIRSDNHGLFPVDVSLIGFFRRVGVEPLGYVSAAVLLIAAAAMSWRAKASPEAVTTLAMPISLLSAPLAWPQYMLIAAPCLFWQPWNTRILAAALLLMVPMNLNFSTVGTNLAIPAGVLYALPIILLAWDGFVKVDFERQVDTSESDHQSTPAVESKPSLALITKLLRRGGSYGAISLFCFILNNILLIGMDALGQPLWLTLAVSATTMISLGFLLQCSLTFEAPYSWAAFGRYALMMLPNIPLAYGLLWLLNERLDVPMHFAAPVATTLMVIWNATGSYWALRKRGVQANQ